MKLVKGSAALALMIGAAVGGCKSESKSTEPSSAKRTAPATQPAVATAAPTAAALADKDMTHVMLKDEPFYTAGPAVSKSTAGTLKAGTKVVMLMPRGSYSQVMTADGKRVYTSTAALKPVGS